MEEGESDAQALMRECREELGVDLSVERRLWMGVHRYEDLTVELVLYRARIVRGMPKALRANELRYLSLREMRSLRFCEADLPLLDALESGAVGLSPG